MRLRTSRTLSIFSIYTRKIEDIGKAEGRAEGEHIGGHVSQRADGVLRGSIQVRALPQASLNKGSRPHRKPVESFNEVLGCEARGKGQNAPVDSPESLRPFKRECENHSWLAWRD